VKNNRTTWKCFTIFVR